MPKKKKIEHMHTHSIVLGLATRKVKATIDFSIHGKMTQRVPSVFLLRAYLLIFHSRRWRPRSGIDDPFSTNTESHVFCYIYIYIFPLELCPWDNICRGSSWWLINMITITVSYMLGKQPMYTHLSSSFFHTERD
jgi:hypothetical protein